MIGSGIFLLPASLAMYGGIAIVGWICAASGALLMSIVFGRLSQYAPDTNGGPYTFTRLGLGDFPGYLVAWGYWISIWATNAAIAVALVGYLSVFFPILGHNAMVSIITGLGFIWLFTWINSKPINSVAQVQIITTILKVIPILAIAIFGIFYINFEHFHPFNLSDESTFSAITSTTTLTLFAFLGMESAGVISGETKNAETTVKKATITGTLITILVYISSSIAIMGIIPPEELAQSNAPFADAASKFWGPIGNYIIAGCAVFATIGALNGWILLQGRIPMAAAQDDLFAPIFGKLNKNNSPIYGIAISSLLASGLMLFNYSKSLVDAFTYMMMLSTLSCLIPYIFSTASLGILVIKKENKRYPAMLWIIALAFCFCLWVIIGCGSEVVYSGFILLLLSIPFYVLLNRNNS